MIGSPVYPAQAAATPSAEGCILVQVQTYPPPAELAAAAALWAVVALAVALAAFLAVRAWRSRLQVRYLRRAIAGDGKIVEFPREPAA